MHPANAPEKLIFWKEKLGYAVGDTASCLFWVTFSRFLNIFYTDVYGLTPAAVGLMLLVTRIWDSGLDPFMGMIADRTNTRWGKFRPWILWGAVPFTIAGVLLFITPDFSPGGKLAYAYITYSLMMLIYTVVNVPYGALLGVISPLSHERTSLSSYRFVGAFVGNLIVQYMLLRMVGFFGKGNPQLGYPMAMSVFAVVAGALFFYLFISTKERVTPPKEKSSVRVDLKDLLRNRPWVVLCTMGVATLLYISMRDAATVYYFKYYVGDQDKVANFMVAGTCCSIVGALSTPLFTRIFGSKRMTFIVLTFIAVVFNGLFYFADPQNIGLMYAAHMIYSIPSAAIFPLMWSMYADTADYGEWRYGRRATGLVFSAASFSQKMGWAVGGSLFSFMLAYVGFVANVAQTPQALAGIRHMMSTIPAALGLVVIVIACFYNLNKKLEQQVGADLRTRKAATGESPA